MSFIAEWRAAERTVICNVIFNCIMRIFPNKYYRRIIRLLSFILLFLLFELIHVISLALADRLNATHVIPSIFASLIASLSIYSINWCYRRSTQLFETATDYYSIPDELDERMGSWVKKVASTKPELIFSIVVLIFLQLGLIILERRGDLPFDYRAFAVLSPFVAIFGGQGLYWALITPTVTNILSEAEFPKELIYWPSPSETPLLRAIAILINSYARWVTVMGSLLLFGLIFFIQDFQSPRIFYPLIGLLAVYSINIWTYVYPRIKLSEVVLASKHQILIKLKKEISSGISPVTDFISEDMDGRTKLLEFHDTISKTPDSINVQRIRTSLTSILVPLLVAIAGFIDWHKLIIEIMVLVTNSTR